MSIVPTRKFVYRLEWYLLVMYVLTLFPAGNDFEVLLNINAYYEWIIKTMTNKFDDELLLYNSNSWMTIKNWNPDPCTDSFWLYWMKKVFLPCFIYELILYLQSQLNKIYLSIIRWKNKSKNSNSFELV